MNPVGRALRQSALLGHPFPSLKLLNNAPLAASLENFLISPGFCRQDRIRVSVRASAFRAVRAKHDHARQGLSLLNAFSHTPHAALTKPEELCINGPLSLPAQTAAKGPTNAIQLFDKGQAAGKSQAIFQQIVHQPLCLCRKRLNPRPPICSTTLKLRMQSFHLPNIRQNALGLWQLVIAAADLAKLDTQIIKQVIDRPLDYRKPWR